jgi:hypothetical protein
MRNKVRPKIKIIRKGEPVDPHSTHIRSDQSAKLKDAALAKIRKVKNDAAVLLKSKTSTPIYSTGKLLKCDGCQEVNPTKRMYKYNRSSQGRIILCERCDEDAELRTFYKLDALDWPRKQYKTFGDTG